MTIEINQFKLNYSGTFNFFLSAEGACMSINDEDTRLPEVEKVPLIIDVEFTEEEHIHSSVEELNPTTTQQTSKPLLFQLGLHQPLLQFQIMLALR